MRAVFVMDPMSTVHVEKDSSYCLMEEAQRRDWEVWHCGPQDLWARGDRLFARATRLSIGPRPKVCTVLEGPVELELGKADALFMRKDPPFDLSYIFSTYLLDLLRRRTVLVNDPWQLRRWNEKMAILEFPDLIPTTVVTRELSELRRFLAEQGGTMVVKPWDGNGGRGVFVVREDDLNCSAILETATDEERRYVMAQSYLPEVRTGDKRILLIDGEPRGWFLRIPEAGEARANMHVGASVEPCELTARDKEICERLRPHLKQGMPFVGIDVIGNYLTEINVTSPTGFQEVRHFTGLHLESELFDWVERQLEERA